MKPLLKLALLISLGTLAMPGWAGCVSGDCQNGYGVYEFNQGRYEGDWVDSKRHGKGVMTYLSGGSYEGDWRNDKRNGQGVYTYYDGREANTGLWRDDKHVASSEARAKRLRLEKKQKRLEREQKATEDRIYRACILDKAKGQKMTAYSVRKAVQSTCRDISKNPSWLDKLRYN